MSRSAADVPMTAAVQADHHFYLLAEPDTVAAELPLPDNGLIGSLPGKAAIYTGVSSGRVTVSVRTLRTPPAAVETGGWDEVLDHSLHAPAGALRVRCLMADPPDLPSLSPYGPGIYRVRIHARGRDTAPDGVAVEPMEDYLILTWPEDRARPDELHRQTDRYGAGWRASTAAYRAQHHPAFREPDQQPRRDPGQPLLPPRPLTPEEIENIRRHREGERDRQAVSEREKLRRVRDRRRDRPLSAD
ncbi:hypothetical protein [Streptomyces xinghaiensis]|uniref:hypothetical protein n=1 Tax=Streptomyces xinghaiensis TaxID=1038928 RepID=UPI002E15C851|nr:hypothetical protein OG463_25660 [Streptomyces xinghaiensis]